ncbi:MAG: tetratricopeptide repeat protein [Chitinophagaceae bacterium]
MSLVQYSKKALSLIEKSQGKKSIEYIKSSNNLILGYRKLGNIAVAKELTKEQLVLCKEVLGNDAELLATIYFNEAIFANEENNYKASAGYLEKTTQILFNNFKQNFYTLSEKEKLAWWQEKDYIFAFYPSLLIKYPEASNEIVESYVNTQLQIKGFVLSDATVALRRARTNGDKELVKLIDDWQSARTLLSKQLSLPIVERYYNVDSIAKIVNNCRKKSSIKKQQV